jgi:hypothetical protein
MTRAGDRAGIGRRAFLRVLAGAAPGLATVAAAVPARAAPAAAGLEEALASLGMVPMNGRTPPAFALERLDGGRRTTLAEQRGRPVLLYFWASW